MTRDRFTEWVEENYEPQLWIAAIVAAGPWGYYLGALAEHAWHLKETIGL